jgi:2-methylcitrate dehydratase PrpD
LDPQEETTIINRRYNTQLTRRGALKSAGAMIAAAALPHRAAIAADPAGSVIATLSTYMSEAHGRALPDKVMQEAKHHILDTFAAMVSGSELPPGIQALRFARATGGRNIATVVASQILCGPIDAAFANGELAHSDESDDDYTAGGAHPGCAVVPAALALGEQSGISGTHFVRAVTLGYDIGMRAYKTLDRGLLKETHNLVGTMGASAGRRMRFKTERPADALAPGLCRTAGRRRYRCVAG